MEIIVNGEMFCLGLWCKYSPIYLGRSADIPGVNFSKKYGSKVTPKLMEMLVKGIMFLS